MDKEDNASKLNQKASVSLYLAAASALLGAIGLGTVLGWTAPAFDTMRANGSVPQLLDSESDKDARTWIGSSMTIGALFGAMISGPMAQYFGRKKALIIYGIPFTIGWLLQAFAKSVSLLIFGRVVAGFSGGLFSGTAPSYIVEISVISVRGFLGACFQLCITIGILFVYVFGAFLSWNHLAGIAAIPTILMAISLFFMPETPAWLLSTNQKEEAVESLKRLRAEDSDNEQEMVQMQEAARIAQQGEEFSAKSYLSRQHGYPFLLSMGLMFFQQFSGINAVMFYATSIFIDSGSSISPKICTIIIGVSQVIATVVGSLLVDRLGRKILLCTSGSLHVLSLAVLGIFYYCDPVDSYGWVPVASLVLFIIGFSIGFGPVPWLMVAEITPQTSRSATSGIATAFNWTCAFLITKNFELLKDALTKYGTFFMFSAFSLLSVIFVVIAVPETKGKSPEEIECYFVDSASSTDQSRNQSLLKNGNNQSNTGDKVELQKLSSS